MKIKNLWNHHPEHHGFPFFRIDFSNSVWENLTHTADEVGHHADTMAFHLLQVYLSKNPPKELYEISQKNNGFWVLGSVVHPGEIIRSVLEIWDPLPDCPLKTHESGLTTRARIVWTKRRKLHLRQWPTQNHLHAPTASFLHQSALKSWPTSPRIAALTKRLPENSDQTDQHYQDREYP